MTTLVAYPSAIKRAEAYKLTDTGDVWGPLLAYSPRDHSIGPTRPPEKVQLTPGETFPQYVQKCAGGWTVEASSLHAGEFHPRMWRRHKDIERFGDPLPFVETTT